MRTGIRTIAAKCRDRITWTNAKWLVRVNVAGWVLQGAIVGALSVCGVGPLPALVSAKVASWLVFVKQLVSAARAG